MGIRIAKAWAWGVWDFRWRKALYHEWAEDVNLNFPLDSYRPFGINNSNNLNRLPLAGFVKRSPINWEDISLLISAKLNSNFQKKQLEHFIIFHNICKYVCLLGTCCVVFKTNMYINIIYVYCFYFWGYVIFMYILHLNSLLGKFSWWWSCLARINYFIVCMGKDEKVNWTVWGRLSFC